MPTLNALFTRPVAQDLLDTIGRLKIGDDLAGALKKTVGSAATDNTALLKNISASAVEENTTVLKKLATTDIDDVVHLADQPSITKIVSKSDSDGLMLGTFKKNVEGMDAGVKKSAAADIDVLRKDLDDQINLLKNEGSKPQTKAAAETSARKYATKYKAVALIAGISVATVISIALANYAKRNGMVCNITSIEQKGSGHLIKYSPEVTIMANDTVTLSSTNCTPTIDGNTVPVIKPSSDNSSVVTDGRNIKLTANGTSGSLTLHTTFENQFQNILDSALKALKDAAGAAAQPLQDILNWAIIVIVVLVMLGVFSSCVAALYKLLG